ncbi:hypothetical protein [Rothia sp. ZJ1223]|uniref:hypothetical protein n=1 Tax=Rothia sp. ZJ1223 TaxID=2811098 RepID=UPI001959BB19|nr:hypothetical protein [Rothia sp. ZJ1223]MBM7050646.1 hypothetical protein [Rothia sp. ZJ1223]
MNKQLLGRIALVLTILCVVIAVQRGGLWWPVTALGAAITLWGTSPGASGD